MKASSSILTLILLLSFHTSISSSSSSHTLNSTSTSTSQNDAVSLLSFKSTADFHNILRFSIHNTSTFCNWTGVQCDNNRKVSRLILDSLNLTGVFAAKTLTQLDQLRVLSLRNNSLTGPIPDLKQLVNLKALFLDHNYFSGVIPVSVSFLHRLRTLDLSYNKLSGEIPVELSKLDRLNYLRLDSNRLNGSIPAFNQSSLEVFNVSVNFLNGRVPVTRTLARFGPDLFSVNPSLCGEIVRTKCRTENAYFSKNATSTSPEIRQTNGFRMKSVKNNRIGVIIGVSVGLLVVITSVLCVILLVKTTSEKRRKEVVTAREMMELAEAADAAAEVMRMQEANELEKKVKKLHQGIEMKKSGNLVFYAGESEVYTVEQLMRASAELLGSGTMGTTYKALVDNRVVVCVKRLDTLRLRGVTNEEFERRMTVLGGVRHPNVVALRSYFQTEGEKLLVYDYQPNGSLFSLIHGSKSTMAKPLHWTSCLKIAEDIAQGLSYLHETCNLVHGNLKSSNVLLGSDFEARISDYCLSTLFNPLADPNNLSYTAYKAPENENLNEPTAKSDVYSFGIVLLELLTGKSASEHPDSTTEDVVRWVKSSRGEGLKVEETRLEMMAEVAVACRVRSPELRPAMWQVIKMLQEVKEAAVMEDCGVEPVLYTVRL